MSSTDEQGTRIRFPLLTERLRIRPLGLDDAADLLAVYGDPETMQYLTPNVPTTLEQAREWVQTKIDLFAADGGLSLWAVELRENGRVVGDAGLQWEDYGWGAPEVGIGGRGLRSLWRLGLGAETAPNNLPAQKLLQRSGFRNVGRNPDGWPVYAISREDFRRSRPDQPI